MKFKNIIIITIIFGLCFPLAGCSKNEVENITSNSDKLHDINFPKIEDVELTLYKGENENFEGIYIELTNNINNKKMNSGKFYLFNKSNIDYKNLEYSLTGVGSVEEKLNERILHPGETYTAIDLQLNSPAFSKDSMKLIINNSEEIELEYIKSINN